MKSHEQIAERLITSPFIIITGRDNEGPCHWIWSDAHLSWRSGCSHINEMLRIKENQQINRGKERYHQNG